MLLNNVTIIGNISLLSNPSIISTYVRLNVIYYLLDKYNSNHKKYNYQCSIYLKFSDIVEVLAICPI